MQFNEVFVDFDARRPGCGVGITALAGAVEIWKVDSSGSQKVGLVTPDVAHRLASEIEKAAVVAERQQRDKAAI